MILKFIMALLIIKCKYFLAPPNMYNLEEEFQSINNTFIKNNTKSFVFQSNNYRFFK